jgi:hypothetical protein
LIDIMEGKKLADNQIRVGAGSRVTNIIRYANSLLNEKNATEIHLSAVGGGAVEKLVNAVEVLKIVNKNLHQNYKIGTMSYQSVDTQGEVDNQRLYPKFEVTLSTSKPTTATKEGYQAPLEEAEREKLNSLLNQRMNDRESRPYRSNQGGYRDNQSGYGGFRSNRGGFRGRGGNRGGYRSNYGGGNRNYEGENRNYGGNRSYGGDNRNRENRNYEGGNRRYEGGRSNGESGYNRNYQSKGRGNYQGNSRGGQRD